MVYRIHLALNVADVGKSVAFYRRLLGSEPDKQSDAFAKFEPVDTAINVALIQAKPVDTVNNDAGLVQAAPVDTASSTGLFQVEPAPAREPKKGELNHLGLQVRNAEEVREAARRLKEAGLDPIPDRSLSGEERILLYDPDGNEWEVFYATAALNVDRSGER
ncbi:VOC family protein [Cohnella faecalis]|uniref:VOC domain-containing protein n=1 Tax=Cohnella faecalis TaxID=2315694 RepID=A0A398CR78_9BACL|nr:VOC family protein [Cohnella faecalis]RIE05043.1 hypothetical protein D3H35_02590 [Cohnella faecalis]